MPINSTAIDFTKIFTVCRRPTTVYGLKFICVNIFKFGIADNYNREQSQVGTFM